MARWFFPLWFFLLSACAGSSSVTGPAGQDAPAGELKAGGALDAPLGAAPGPGPAPVAAAAQPLTGGFPAPGQDPSGKFFWMSLLDEKPVCQLLGKNLIQYKINGFVHFTNPNNLDIPEKYIEVLAMGSLRVVDLLTSNYMEVPFSYKPGFDEFGVKYHKVGYFEFNVMGESKYHLRFYVVLPKGPNPTSTPWTPCPDVVCAPPGTDGLLPKVIANSASGDLEQSFSPESTIAVCQVGGGNFDFPIMIDGD